MTDTNTALDINVIDIISSSKCHRGFPVEISILLGTGQRYHTYIAPTQEWLNSTAKNQQTLDVNSDEIKNNSKSPKEVCNDILLLCGQLDMFSDSPIMDNLWLEKLFKAAGTIHRIKCKSIEALISESQRNSWEEKKVFINDLFGHSETSAVDQSNTVRMALNIFFSDQIYNLPDQGLPLAEVILTT